MKKIFYWLSVAATALIVPALIAAAGELPESNAIERLQSDLDVIFSDSRFSGAHWGVQIYSLDRKECLYEKNADRLYVPASNTKIITASVALLRLGPNYRFRTMLLADGPVADGILQGNLIVAGFGDPSISVKTPDEDPFRVFRTWAQKLKEKGIRGISGDILGDASSFDRSALGEGWAWDDLTEGYAAPVSALQFNENRLWLKIIPSGKNGSVPFIKLIPLPLYWIVENKLKIETGSGEPDIKITRNITEDGILIRGTVPGNRTEIIKSVSVYNPVLWYLSALKHTLASEDIRVPACAIRETTGTDPDSKTVLETHLSPPLAEIIKPLLKDSQNLCAETLTRTIGLELAGEGSFAAGRSIIEETLARMAIDPDRYAYADGSGLSRLNLVSAEVLVRILRSMYRHPYFNCFYDALAIAGKDGTLENRLIGTAAESNLHAKTGSLSRVSAISGYIKTADGEMLAVSILTNNFLVPKSEADAAQDRVLIKLAKFSRNRQAGVSGRIE